MVQPHLRAVLLKKFFEPCGQRGAFDAWLMNAFTSYHRWMAVLLAAQREQDQLSWSKSALSPAMSLQLVSSSRHPLRRPHCHTSSLLSVPPTSDSWRNDLICFFTLDRVFHFAAMTALPQS